MKILHVIDHYNLGGAQRVVEAILPSLPSSMLLALRKKGDPKDQIAIPDEKVLLPPRGNLLAQMLRLLRAPRLIRQGDFQIVHCHLPYSWFFGLWLNWVLPAANRPRLVFHEHDSIKLTSWYYPMLVRAARRAGTVIAVSAYVQNQIAAHGIPLEEIHLLHNPIDTHHFSPGPVHLERFQRLSELGQSNRLVGFAGRLVGYKGWQYILAAADRLRGENIQFLIAGIGPDLEKIKHQIQQMNLQDRVILLGYVDRMVDFYRLIDLLVIASERESFGLVQLEAQASGVPVLLFENEAALELAGQQSTVILPYGDVEAVVENIQHLLGDSDAYDRLVEKGLDNTKQYELPGYIARLSQIYADILHRKGRK